MLCRLAFVFVAFSTLAAAALSQTPVLPLPKEMLKQVSDDTGQPVVFGQRNSLIWGMSTKSVRYGQPIPILLWLYNPTRRRKPVQTCDIGEPYGSVDVFDSSGVRVLSHSEQRPKREVLPDGTIIIRGFPICGRNMIFFIPPHGVVHGTFSKMDPDFAWDLRGDYSLPPGRYVIVPSVKDKDGNPITRTVINPPNGLWVEVAEPESR